MKTNDQLKDEVREKYREIVKISSFSGCCCGGTGGCQTHETTTFTMKDEGYEHQPGYAKEADLGLGCGIPTEFARINEGDTVVDLGAGAGNDAFIARSLTGKHGEVIGVDFTKEMIIQARKNALKLNYKNVHFIHGDIEAIPIEVDTADVVLSNCVLNLVPDKQKAFSEIYRILKPGGHFCVSDIVTQGTMPPELQESAVLYAGCVAGALPQDQYLKIIEENGFREVTVHKSKRIDIPEATLSRYLDAVALKQYHESLNGIFSITVTGKK